MYRLLIVDDEHMIHLSLRKLVESSGLDIEVIGDAEDGAEALRLLERQEADLVVTDIRMPEMDGLAFIERAQRLHPGIGFMILSGYNSFEYARQAMKYGVSDFLLKPIDPDQFLAALQEMVANLRKNEARFSRQSEWLAALQATVKELATRIWETDEQAAWKTLQRIADHCRTADADAGERKLASCAPSVVKQLEQEMREKGVELPAERTLLRDWPGSAEDSLKELRAIAADLMRQLRGARNLGARNNMEKVLKYLESHYADPMLSLKGVAAAFRMSDTYLSRTLKEEMNVNFVKYLIRVRMNKARELLEATDLSTTEIAERVGFSDYPHFSKTFKKVFGLTPTEDRKQRRSLRGG
ncbi:response regulator [Cohnella sp.]|uniref:response regulator transcription factor n=1 Tax=Cohnella sp. TaxID=1883426 RepID=UPI00356A4819